VPRLRHICGWNDAHDGSFRAVLRPSAAPYPEAPPQPGTVTAPRSRLGGEGWVATRSACAAEPPVTNSGDMDPKGHRRRRRRCEVADEHSVGPRVNFRQGVLERSNRTCGTGGAPLVRPRRSPAGRAVRGRAARASRPSFPDASTDRVSCAGSVHEMPGCVTVRRLASLVVAARRRAARKGDDAVAARRWTIAAVVRSAAPRRPTLRAVDRSARPPRHA
jgi:hypothetical protein